LPVSATPTQAPRQEPPARRTREIQTEGLVLLIGIVAFMWLIEVVNTLDSNHLDNDGIIPRNLDRLWGIFTAPFIHVSFAHLISNTVPLIFMGVIIALAGAARLAAVTAIVIVIGGLGTWLIGPSNSSTIGASGVVFGYAAYLLARGVFNRSVLELFTGAVVAVIWGGALLSSLIPHYGISWQDHLCGAIGGVVAAYLLSNHRTAKPGSPSNTSALDRALAK
jgi:membrane associated rhomboid family serine protease